jgi:hypothetical protein
VGVLVADLVVRSAVAFFLGTSVLFGWAFFREKSPESDRQA